MAQRTDEDYEAIREENKKAFERELEMLDVFIHRAVCDICEKKDGAHVFSCPYAIEED